MNEEKKIILNKELYTIEAIKSTIKAFDKLAKFIIEEEKKEYLIRVTEIKTEVKDRICDEFCNYVLYLMKKN